MVGSWGYPEATTDTVQVAVPTDLAQPVAEFVADPEAFIAAMQHNEDALSTALVEVEEGTWIAPGAIVAVEQVEWSETRILLAGGGFVLVKGTATEVLQRITQRLSEARERLHVPPNKETSTD